MIGKKLGPHEITAELGEGGMGGVFRSGSHLHLFRPLSGGAVEIRVRTGWSSAGSP